MVCVSVGGWWFAESSGGVVRCMEGVRWEVCTGLGGAWLVWGGAGEEGEERVCEKDCNSMDEDGVG